MYFAKKTCASIKKCGDKYKGVGAKPLLSLIRVFRAETGSLRNCSKNETKMDLKGNSVSGLDLLYFIYLDCNNI